MKAELCIFISFVFTFTAYAFHLTPKFGSWRRTTPPPANLMATECAIEQLLHCSKYGDKFAIFDSFFADCVEVPGVKCIIPSVRKRKDMHGKTQLINPLSFEAVDIDDLLKGAVAVINKVLKEEHPFSIEKGAMGAIRGVGGGKTFFISHLQRELCKPEHTHILPVLITLGGKWGYNDFQRYKHMFPMNPEKAFALGIIARIASVSFALPHKKVVARIMKAKKEWMRLFEFDFRGDHLALFLVYRAQKRGVRDIVLMVDEAHRGHEMITDVYRPNNTVDYTFHLHWALLRHKILRELGMRGAYVESGVQPTVALGSEAAPYSYSMLLSEVLNATTVTQNLFLSDLDADGSIHIVIPHLAHEESINCNSAGRNDSTGMTFQWLCQIAAYYAHSPRVLEFAQDYLRCHIDRTTNPRSLIVTSTMVRDLIDYVEQHLQAMNPALYNNSEPTLDTLYNMLLNGWVYARPPFNEAIRNSLFVNSLKTWDGFPPSLDTRLMHPCPPAIPERSGK